MACTWRCWPCARSWLGAVGIELSTGRGQHRLMEILTVAGEREWQSEFLRAGVADVVADIIALDADGRGNRGSHRYSSHVRMQGDRRTKAPYAPQVPRNPWPTLRRNPDVDGAWLFGGRHGLALAVEGVVAVAADYLAEVLCGGCGAHWPCVGSERIEPSQRGRPVVTRQLRPLVIVAALGEHLMLRALTEISQAC